MPASAEERAEAARKAQERLAELERKNNAAMAEKGETNEYDGDR